MRPKILNSHERSYFHSYELGCVPKRSFNSQLIKRANKATEIMAKDLTQNLVHLSGKRLRTDVSTELGLDHREGRLDVRPFVVVLQELLAVVGEEPVHPNPKGTTRLRCLVRGVPPVV